MFLSNISFVIFPSLGKIERQLYVATTGKNFALVILSGLTNLVFSWDDSSLSLSLAMESLPSNCAMCDNLGLSLIFSTGGGGLEGGTGRGGGGPPPPKSFPG